MLPAAAQQASGFNSAWTRLLRDHLLNLIHSRPAFPSATTPPISHYPHHTHVRIYTHHHLHHSSSSVTSSSITHLRIAEEHSKVCCPRLVTLAWSSGPAKRALSDWLPLRLPSEVTVLVCLSVPPVKLSCNTLYTTAPCISTNSVHHCFILYLLFGSLLAASTVSHDLCILDTLAWKEQERTYLAALFCAIRGAFLFLRCFSAALDQMTEPALQVWQNNADHNRRWRLCREQNNSRPILQTMWPVWSDQESKLSHLTPSHLAGQFELNNF